jgi:uncharacterized RDD family membrane protein YckC
MTQEELEAIKQAFRNLDDHELLRRVALEESEFRNEALQIAHAELELRNIKPLSADEYMAQFPKETPVSLAQMQTTPERKPVGGEGGNEPKYGGFWRRFAAMLLDGLVFLPLVSLILWLDTLSKYAQVYLFVPTRILGIFYHVYLVQRFGGTPGKLIMGLNITKLDGVPVGSREALLRYLPELILSICMGLSFSYASFQMTDADQALSFMARSQRQASLAPDFGLIQTLNSIWTWSELLVLLTNKKRRALHDFIAGTVVIQRRPAAA